MKDHDHDDPQVEGASFLLERKEQHPVQLGYRELWGEYEDVPHQGTERASFGCAHALLAAGRLSTVDNR